MAVRSKYSAIKRRWRYLMSSGGSGAMAVWASLGTGAGSTVTGGRGSASTASSSFWNSKNLMAWGTPSSVTVKSLAVRPSMGLPLLSLTLTVWITNWVLVWKVVGCWAHSEQVRMIKTNTGKNARATWVLSARLFIL